MESTERLTAHFTVAEMACRCCGEAPMDAGFMQQLEALRLAYAHPMPVTSGYRCAAHNQAVSSSGPGGPHTTGRAADVRVSGPRAYLLLAFALAHDFTGIGIKQHGPAAKRFLHVDTVPRRQRLIWSYP